MGNGMMCATTPTPYGGGGWWWRATPMRRGSGAERGPSNGPNAPV